MSLTEQLMNRLSDGKFIQQATIPRLQDTMPLSTTHNFPFIMFDVQFIEPAILVLQDDLSHEDN